MARYATKHVVIRKPGGPLWRLSGPELSRVLDIPLATANGVLYNTHIGAGVIGAAALAGFSLDANFEGVPRDDPYPGSVQSTSARPGAGSGTGSQRYGKLPLRLADFPGREWDLIGRRGPGDFTGSRYGVWGFEVAEHGYLVSLSHAKDDLTARREDLVGGYEGIVITRDATEAAWQALERRFPGLKATADFREQNPSVAIRRPSQLAIYAKKYGWDCEWTD